MSTRNSEDPLLSPTQSEPPLALFDRSELSRLESEANYRSLHQLEMVSATHGWRAGRKLTLFCGNDYLGLSWAPEVIAAFRSAAREGGVGAGAARLVSGQRSAHQRLEEELADFLERPRVLTFSSGYLANLGVISALAGRNDLVLADRLVHASLLDGIRLSGARLRRYRHRSLDHLQTHLERADESGRSARRFLVSDGVFSMDGDLAPLSPLLDLAERYRAGLILDDAHGIGVLGQQGRGLCEQCEIDCARLPLLIGTFGKAFGTAGAFVAAENELIEYLIQKARTFIYTTAQPPAMVEATRASLRLLAEPWRREHLRALINRFRRGAEQLALPLMPSITPIQPLLLGDNRRALNWSHQLEQRGLLVSAIRPPTVPAGSARLRITLSAAHTESELDRLLEALETIQSSEHSPGVE